jgi:hypothetical protein
MLNVVFTLLILLSISIGLGSTLGAASIESDSPRRLPNWFDRINTAIALVIALWLVLSILFRSLSWLPTGGFILLVTGKYLYLRFSSARFYLRLNNSIHLALLCSYPLIAFPVWKLTVKGLAPGLSSIFDVMLIGMIMIPGVVLLMAGLIGLSKLNKSRE